mgnify:CR=1 FL=1
MSSVYTSPFSTFTPPTSQGAKAPPSLLAAAKASLHDEESKGSEVASSSDHVHSHIPNSADTNHVSSKLFLSV